MDFSTLSPSTVSVADTQAYAIDTQEGNAFVGDTIMLKPVVSRKRKALSHAKSPVRTAKGRTGKERKVLHGFMQAQLPEGPMRSALCSLSLAKTLSAQWFAYRASSRQLFTVSQKVCIRSARCISLRSNRDLQIRPRH